MDIKKYDSKTIKSYVIAVVAKQLEKSIEEIDFMLSLVEQGADVLDCIEIVMRLEEQFGLEISDIDADKIVSVQSAIDYVESCLE